MDFNKIVKKMLKKWWKVLFKEDIFEIIDPEKKEKYQNKVNKIIYRLKAEWYIINLKSWVYIIPDKEDNELNTIDLIEKYYLKLLKKYIISYVWNNYYISGLKSLEIYNKNYQINDKIFIVNRNLNKRIKFWNFEIIFKTISGKQNWKKVNLFNKFFNNFTQKKMIEQTEFRISCLELALLESAIISDNINWFDFNILNKTIKKYHSIFKNDIFYEIWKYKYIMSFNRLKELSKNIDKKLYNIFLDIIKKNWWLFIWEWLRWI
jgi:hypothetical protein